MRTTTHHHLYVYAALLLFITSCKLDKPDFANFKSDTTANTGGSSSDGGTTALSSTYQPVTKASYWKYTYTLNGATDTVTTTMTGDSTMINNRMYYVGASVYKNASFPSETGYISRDKHIYTSRSVAQGDTVELYYLNDTTATGRGWIAPINSTGAVNGIPGQFVGTIVEKGITRTVAGKTFKNVIHSQVNLQYNYGSGFSTFITYDDYVALGIGIIEVDSNGSGVTGTELLFDYSIK